MEPNWKSCDDMRGLVFSMILEKRKNDMTDMTLNDIYVFCNNILVSFESKIDVSESVRYSKSVVYYSYDQDRLNAVFNELYCF